MAAVVSVGTALVLTGCGGVQVARDPSPTPSPSVSTSSSVEPTALPSDAAPPFPADTTRQLADNAGKWDLVFTGVRLEHHHGFDRMVLELSGTGSPGWVVDYRPEAVLEGSGEVVALRGSAILQIVASGTTWPDPRGDDYYNGPRRIPAEDGRLVAELYVAGTNEGYTTVFAGVEAGRVPFRVFALAAPPRLVVDLADDPG